MGLQGLAFLESGRRRDRGWKCLSLCVSGIILLDAQILREEVAET